MADDGPADRVAAPPDPRREQPRDSLFLHATLTQAGGDPAGFIVRVRNLSAGGMMAEVGGPFDRGDAVSVDLRGVGTIEGVVAWRVEGRIGIAFSTPIDPQRARKTVSVRPASPVPVARLRSVKRPKLFG